MPQDAWNDKRERQYEHIKESYKERGVGTDEAEERAARTVNKERARSGDIVKGRGIGLGTHHVSYGAAVADISTRSPLDSGAVCWASQALRSLSARSSSAALTKSGGVTFLSPK